MLHYPATHFERLWRKWGAQIIRLSRPAFPEATTIAGITISATFLQFALAEIWLSPKFLRVPTWVPVLHSCSNVQVVPPSFHLEALTCSFVPLLCFPQKLLDCFE